MLSCWKTCQMDILIEVEHDVEDGTGAQRTRVVSGARSNLSQMLLQRVLMDVERVGCAGDGPIVLEEAFQGVYGIGELQWGVAVKNLFDILALCCEWDQVGKELHVDLIVALDVHGPLAMAGVERFACLLEGLAEPRVVGSGGVEAEAEPYPVALGVHEKLLGEGAELFLRADVGQEDNHLIGGDGAAGCIDALRFHLELREHLVVAFG